MFSFMMREDSITSKAQNTLGNFMVIQHHKRRLYHKMTRFFQNLVKIQQRARLQIHLYSKFHSDIIEKLEDKIQLVRDRFNSNAGFQKRFPNFITELDSVTEWAKEHVITGLMQTFKL